MTQENTSMEEPQVVTSVRRIYAVESPRPSLDNSNIPTTRPASDVEGPVLLVFGEQIPLSEVAEMAKTNGIRCPDPKSIQTYEQETWEYLRQVIDKLVESADSTNLKSIVAQLFAENIVRGRAFFATACMRCQSKNPDLTPVYAALAGLVNIYFPPIGDILYRRLRYKFSHMLTEYDEDSMNATTKFLSHLINLRVAWILDSITLIFRCLEEETEERLKLAVTFFKELRFPGRAGMFRDVHREFTRIKEAEGLKKKIRDMAASVVAKKNWNCVFREGSIVPSELQWVIPLLRPRLCHFINTNPATNQDIFQGDVYRSDKYFLKRERAYYLFTSIILCENYWNSISPEDQRYFSYYDEVFRKSGREDQQSFFNELLPIIVVEDEVKVCLRIFKYLLCLKKELRSVVPLIEFLCKNEAYREALETCFLVMWLMVAGEAQFISDAAESFAELLNRGLLSWDFVAHLPFEPQDLTKNQYTFLQEFFQLYECRYDSDLISVNLSHYCPCVPAAIMFFRIIYLGEVADNLEKLSKVKNYMKPTKLKRTKTLIKNSKAQKKFKSDGSCY